MTNIPKTKAYIGTDPYIFISYSHRDNDVVMRFVSALQQKYNVWFDEGIHYGKEWEDDIAYHLSNCTIFLYMITENSLASENCKDEIYHARKLKKTFINILIDSNTKLTDSFQLRYDRYQMCKLDTFASFESAIEDLARKCGDFEQVISKEYIAAVEAERKAKEEAERKAKEEAERRAAEEAERKAREEAERKAKEEAERKAKEEAERKAREEAERKAKEEAERKAKEEAERKAKEEAERKAREEAERKAKEVSTDVDADANYDLLSDVSTNDTPNDDNADAYNVEAIATSVESDIDFSEDNS